MKHIYLTYLLSLLFAGLVFTSCDDEETTPAPAPVTVDINTTTASFSYTGANSLPPAVVSFTNNSINATSYLWEFGDGDTSTLSDPQHLYTQSGTYNVKLTATGATGSASSVKTIIVNEVLPPNISLSVWEYDYNFSFLGYHLTPRTAPYNLEQGEDLIIQWYVSAGSKPLRSFKMVNTGSNTLSGIPLTEDGKQVANGLYLLNSNPNSYNDLLVIPATLLPGQGPVEFEFTVYDSDSSTSVTETIEINIAPTSAPAQIKSTNLTFYSGSPDRYYSTRTDQVYEYSHFSNSPTTAALVDFGYLFSSNTSSGHTIASMNSWYFGFSNGGFNTTLFKPTALSQTNFNNITISGLQTAYDNAAGTATTAAINLSPGDVIAFKTSGNRYGLIYVNNTNNTWSTYIDIDLKVQR